MTSVDLDRIELLKTSYCWYTIMGPHGRMQDTYVVDVIMFDFAEAFNTVSHIVLINKLNLLGIGGSLLIWIFDFLTVRTM